MNAVVAEINRNLREQMRSMAQGYFWGQLDATDNQLLDIEDSAAFAESFLASGESAGSVRRQYEAFVAELVAEREAAQNAHEVRV